MSEYVRTKKNSPYYLYRYKGKDNNGNEIIKEVSTKVPIYKGKHKREEKKQKEKAMEIGREKVKEFLSAQKSMTDTSDYSRWKFGDYARLYLSICDLDVGTVNMYSSILEKHIIPKIGDIILCDLTQQHLNNYIRHKRDECKEKQRALDKKLEEAKKSGTPAKIMSSERPCTYSIRKHRDIIRLILSYAVQEGALKENVATKINKMLLKSLPKNVNRTEPFTKEEICKLLIAIVGSKIETAVILASSLGLRREEILGLKFSDIDWDNNIIYIRDVIIKANGVSSSIYRNSTKTSSSRQYLPMTEALKEYLVMVRAEQDKLREKLGDSYDNHTIAYEDSDKEIKEWDYREHNLDFICRDEFGAVMRPDYISHTYKKLLEDNGLRHTRFHDLRHSVGTIVLEETHDLKMAQITLRHTNINTTSDIYTAIVGREYKQQGVDVMAPVLSTVIEKKKDEIT
ncbi:MAG: site-specific integrase [Lachnospiraceae bacterium]|nr:site-specific integrase [Lachnospiraceae bacterium]